MVHMTGNLFQLFDFKAQGSIKAGPVLSLDQGTVYFTDRRRVLYAVHTGIGEANDPAPDTAYPQVIGAPDVWAQHVTGDNVGVAVVDTGIAPMEGLLYNAKGEARLVAPPVQVRRAPDPSCRARSYRSGTLRSVPLPSCCRLRPAPQNWHSAQTLSPHRLESQRPCIGTATPDHRTAHRSTRRRLGL